MNPSLLVVAVLFTEPAPKEAPKKDPPSLEGHWVVETATHACNVEQVPPGTYVKFGKDGKAFAKEGVDDPGHELNFTIDAAQSPNHLDLELIETNGNHPPCRGIFRIEGDTLLICLSMDGKRPTEFASPAGSKHNLIKLSRAKKEQ